MNQQPNKTPGPYSIWLRDAAGRLLWEPFLVYSLREVRRQLARTDYVVSAYALATGEEVRA